MNDEMAGEIRHTIGATGTFVLRTVSGNVEIEGTDGDEAIVRAKGGNGHGGMPPLTVERTENALRVEPERRASGLFGTSLGRLGVASVDFRVLVPRSARVEISAVSADVAGRDLHGDQSYREVSGDLTLDDVSGRIALTTVSGDASVMATQPMEVNATTTSGDIEIAGGRLDLLRARSVSGDIQLSGELVPGPEHRVETVSGDLRLQSSGGLTVEASGPAVAVRSELSRLAGKMPDQRSLVIGDGAARLKFRSLSGDVHVHGARRVATAEPAEPPFAPPPPRPEAPPQPPPPPRDSLDVLRALERGEIDVDEASRLLEVPDRG